MPDALFFEFTGASAHDYRAVNTILGLDPATGTSGIGDGFEPCSESVSCRLWTVPTWMPSTALAQLEVLEVLEAERAVERERPI
jgi:hypothetical protein